MMTKKRMLTVAGLLVVATVATIVFAMQGGAANDEKSKYRTTAVDIGSITQTVTANGTINPVALVSVGSQVSGTVVSLQADFNDRVKKGQVLLKLDPTIFEAQIRQGEASLASMMATLRLARNNYDRNKNLAEKNFVSERALGQSRTELEVAEANINVARAQLARYQADLNNSVIRSPIDGIVVKRAIDLGQTVAASFATPTLFQIAQDLTKMQIDTSVSEADIGALKPGLPARFVVEAYPDQEFSAQMRQFRLAANVVQNVVTYNVVLDVDNKEQLLKPGMTAQVRLLVGNRPSAVRIPTAALRFRLSEEETEKELKSARDLAAKTGRASVVAERDEDADFSSKKKVTRAFKVYKLGADKQAKPVEIQIGISNFRYTEVLGGDLKQGDQVVTRTLAGDGAK